VKTRKTTSIAALIASLATPGVVLGLPAFQDTPQPPAEQAPEKAPENAPGTDEGGLNSPLEIQAPAPSAPTTQPAVSQEATAPAKNGNGQSAGPASGRKSIVGDDKLVALQFRDQKIDVLVDTISQWTGKVVIPKQTALAPIKVTIISDRMMPKSEALNVIFQGLRLNGLGVVETEDMILIDNLTDINHLQPAKVLGPEVDVMALPEIGSIVIKVFRIKNTKASQVFERLQDSLPTYATLQVDNNSNQIILDGDVALAKRVQRMIDILDVVAYVDVKTETIKLAYQDAQTISSIVTDLFSARAPTGGASTPRGGATPQQGNRAPGRGGQNQASNELVGTSEQLVVTVLPATNSMTIRAEPTIMKEIKALIAALDLPSSQSNEQIFRLYDLKFTDPLKVQTVLGSLLESGGGANSRARTGGNQRNNTGINRAGGGGGGEAGADVAIANIFRIEAYPDSNRLIVVSKTPQNFQWLDDLIQRIDQPLDAGLPRNIPLKYASAVELAEILNALLAPSGSTSSITAPATGLSGIDFDTAGGSSTGSADRTSTPTDTGTGGGTAPGQIQFPWGTARGAGDGTASEVSALVGKSRVVPNAGQNSLLILAPQEIQDSLAKIVMDLDHPGRQVMISVILAEVQLGDELAFGIKWGQDVAPTNPNNAVVVNGNGTNGEMFEGTKTGIFLPDLDTGILAFGVNANVVLQALAAKTTVRILQQPRVFTMDNKEAKFFTGQDVPFQSSSLTDANTGGDVNASFTQIAVGIGLNVRPRITKDRNVAMEIEVLLSNVNNTTPAGVGGNPVIDRRQTNTTVTVENNQTIVLSGIRREQENRIKNKVPFLGDIPGLDLIFANTSEVKTTSELVIFVTPLVVDNPSENNDNFNQRERVRLEELQKPLKEMSLEAVENHKVFTPDSKEKPDPVGDPLAPIETPVRTPAPVAPPAAAPAPAAPAPAAPAPAAPAPAAPPPPAPITP
jgi:general secretion pathway protein D